MSDCQLWTKAKTRDGYGQVNIAKRTLYAHRLSWEKHRGPIPHGMCVLHHCDNPACINPDHLFLGTHGDNARDRDAKDRVRHGSRHRSALLTEEQVRAIRASGLSHRVLGNMYGVSAITIHDIKSGKTWRRLL